MHVQAFSFAFNLGHYHINVADAVTIIEESTLKGNLRGNCSVISYNIMDEKKFWSGKLKDICEKETKVTAIDDPDSKKIITKLTVDQVRRTCTPTMTKSHTVVQIHSVLQGFNFGEFRKL